MGSIQEAVLIFDNARTIEYANESARRLVSVGRTLKGVKLESALRSPSLLEFLSHPGIGAGGQAASGILGVARGGIVV